MRVKWKYIVAAIVGLVVIACFVYIFYPKDKPIWIGAGQPKQNCMIQGSILCQRSDELPANWNVDGIRHEEQFTSCQDLTDCRNCSECKEKYPDVFK